jgi:KDO2-lipid IV(A) lauroyltransferase
MKRLAVNIARGILYLLARFPLKFQYFVGDVLAWIFKNVLKYRYSVVCTNIARSFPDKKYKEVRQIVDDFYTHMGELIVESVWFGGSSRKRVIKSGLVRVTNTEVLEEYFQKTPSVTLLSTHCGNWELQGGLFTYCDASGVPYTFGEENVRMVYKKLSSDVSDEVFKRNRIALLSKDGAQCVIESSNILRYAISHRKDKMIYAYPADQAPYSGAGKHFIGDFMNQPTNAMQGSVGVACKLAHSVLYVKMQRVKRGHYDLSFIPICDDASKTTPEELLRKYYDLLQEEINETPANWLWSHKRWK